MALELSKSTICKKCHVIEDENRDNRLDSVFFCDCFRDKTPYDIDGFIKKVKDGELELTYLPSIDFSKFNT